uniref:Tricin synthase 1-like n=1 Tax=Tetraselmis sp. GSL018 TaxID=582737 RepID=A0A061SE34_9CHLO
MAFIDANKRGYIKYYELSHKLVRPGGLIIADNVLFYGKVGDPAATDRYTQALRDFNDHILRDDRVSLSMVPIGDGMALCRKRQ